MRSRNFYRFLLIAFLLSANSPDKTFAADLPNPSTDRKILRYGIHVSRIGSLDPHHASASSDRIIADLMFNGLLRYRPGAVPEIEPDLATQMPDMHIVDGKQVWTFHLKKGVMFHPQEGMASHALTADDVVFSFQKAADPKFSAYAGEYVGMTFDTVNEHTVRITAQSPMSSILFFPKVSNYAGGVIVSSRAVKGMGYDYFKRHPVGTGPFLFHPGADEKKIVLAAHDAYFRGRPKLAGVEIHLMSDIAVREAALRSGMLEMIVGSGDVDWLKRNRQDAAFALDVHGVGEVITLHLNTSKKPLQDVRVRKAILYALDREAFLKGASRLVISKIHSPVPAPLLPGGISEQEARSFQIDYDLDLSKAKRLLAEAGLSGGFSLKAIVSEKRIYRFIYDLLSEQLAKIGVNLQLEIVSHSKMHERIRADESDLVVYGAWRPNADVFLTRFFHSDSIVLSGQTPDTNFSHYAGADALIEAARKEIDPGNQVRLWTHAQIKILSDAVAYPLFFLKQCQLRSRKVDYGHPVSASMALYPQFTENTRILE